MRYYLVFFILVLQQIAAAQSSDSTSIIRTKDILGYWTAIGTNQHQVEFKYKDHELILVTDDQTSFYFIGADSILTTNNKGVLIRWPPSACAVRSIGNSRIEIEYMPFSMTPYKLKYKRTIPAARSQ